MDGLCVVQTTTDSLEHARLMSSKIIEARLAACAQIEQIESHYIWNGEMCRTSEYKVSLKTIGARYNEIMMSIKAMHHYGLAEIILIPINNASEEYSEWVQLSVERFA